MFYKKTGKPEVGDLVVCTVKKVLYHSVFVSLDEYKNLEGMIHISEIAPGRIRNLRDYVKEGKTIVCKVLSINRQGNIDLSLRRVGSGLMVKKLNEHRQEEKAEKLLKQVGKELNLDLETMYKKVGYRAIEEHGSLHNFFQDVVVMGKGVIDRFKLDKKLADLLYNRITEKIKPIEVKVGGILTLKSYKSDGVSIIKSILTKLQSKAKISYLGAPKYKIDVYAPDYKSAETSLKNLVDLCINEIKKSGGFGEFEKHE